MGEATVFAISKCRSKARWRQNMAGKSTKKNNPAGTLPAANGAGGVTEAAANAAKRAEFQEAMQRKTALKEFHGLSPGLLLLKTKRVCLC